MLNWRLGEKRHLHQEFKVWARASRSSVWQNKKSKLVKSGCQGNSGPNFHLNSCLEEQEETTPVLCAFVSIWEVCCAVTPEGQMFTAAVGQQGRSEGKCSWAKTHLRAFRTKWWNYILKKKLFVAQEDSVLSKQVHIKNENNEQGCF